MRQREALTEQLDGVLGLVPSRIAGLTYTHVHDETVSVWLHSEHPLAGRAACASRSSVASGHDPDYLGASGAIDFPPEVVRVPLQPRLSLPYATIIASSSGTRSAV